METVQTANADGMETMVKYVREIRINYRGRKKAMVSIASASDAAEFIRRILPDNSREHFVVLYLDGMHQINCYAVVNTGTVNCCPVHPREVFQRAVMAGATAIIAAHNHPSGNAKPSDEDRRVTEGLRNAGELLGIKLLDHVVLGDDCHYSFSEMGSL